MCMVYENQGKPSYNMRHCNQDTSYGYVCENQNKPYYNMRHYNQETFYGR